MDKQILKGFISHLVNNNVSDEVFQKCANTLVQNSILDDEHVQRGFNKVIKQASENPEIPSVTKLHPDTVDSVVAVALAKHNLLQ